MDIREIMDRVLFALSVPQCVCCGERLDYGQKALCPKCSAEFEGFKHRNCSRCTRVLNKCDCSNEYLEGHYIKRVIKSFRYLDRENAKPGNSLIYSLKRDNRSDVLDRCTDELVSAIRNSIENPENYIITNIPRRPSAIIEYGIDHSELLAKSVAKRLGARYKSLLYSNARTPQKSLERAERLKNAKFVLKRTRLPQNSSIIIVDDIITTGASMGKAASLIRSLGVKNIVAAALAVSYKDQ